MSPRVDITRKDLDADQLSNLLLAIQRVYSEYDVVRFTATTVLGEIRFNITVKEQRP